MVSRTADALSLRNAYSLLRSERLITHNLIVGGGTVLAGVLGFAFQSLFAHQLRPADYGAAFAVISLISFIGLPANAFTLAMARQTSRDKALGDFERSAALLKKGNATLLLLGAATGAVMVILSPELSGFLHVPSQ